VLVAVDIDPDADNRLKLRRAADIENLGEP